MLLSLSLPSPDRLCTVHYLPDKISYEKFKGLFEVTYSCNISINTGRYIFNYFLLKDTLFEMAEPGRVDTLLKVENGKILEKVTAFNK